MLFSDKNLNLMQIEIMQEAFPSLSWLEAKSALNDVKMCASAVNLLKNDNGTHYRNIYTRYYINDFLFGHLNQALTGINEEVAIDFSKINLFLETKPYSDENRYTLPAVLLKQRVYGDLLTCLDYMEKYSLGPDQIKQIFLTTDTTFSFIRGDLLKKPAFRKYDLQTKKEYTHNRMLMDKSLARIASHIGAKEVLSELFKDKLPADFQLNQSYCFKKGEDPCTILDFLIEKQLPLLAISLLKQTYAQTKDQQSLLDMAKGSYTHQAFQRVYHNDSTVEPHQKLIFDYFQQNISTALFTQYLTNKALQNWNEPQIASNNKRTISNSDLSNQHLFHNELTR